MTIRFCATVRRHLGTGIHNIEAIQYRGELGRVRAKAHNKMLQLWGRLATAAAEEAGEIELDIVRRCIVDVDPWGATVRWPSGRTTGISYYIAVD